MILTRRGQSILEYTMIVAIIVAVIYYMGTGIKRGVQSLVKVTADQVGNQQNSDQDFNDAQQGFMSGSNSVVVDEINSENQEAGYFNASGNAVYTTNTTYNESTNTYENTQTNEGFTADNQ
jgi:predicted PurR-regulated permease PerM